MANRRGTLVGHYLMRLIGGVAVIFGILMLFSALSRSDLIGLALGVVLVGGGAYLLKRSGKTGRVKEVAATRGTS
ncbi:hypothetical protein AB0877_16710 [Micromonospora sp. NPDC047644]|uniref:hypothetical protein n=1 Tax=Micromonospora sp. NPDC047644 TaxID=3157203 RepID=UPI003451A24C